MALPSPISFVETHKEILLQKMAWSREYLFCFVGPENDTKIKITRKIVNQIEWQSFVMQIRDSEYVTKQAGGASSESQSTKSTLENSQVNRNRG